MKRLLTLVLSLGLASAAFAHAPEGVVHQAFQWPAGTEPTLDGDLSEWEIVPDDYRIPFSICLDGEGNPPTDFSDLNSRGHRRLERKREQALRDGPAFR